VRRMRDVSMNSEYEDHLKATFQDANSLLNSIRNDPEVSRFSKSLRTFAKSLALDENGKMRIDVETMKQIGTVVVELLNNELKYIPLPHMEINFKGAELVTENAVIQVPDLVPNQVTIETHTYTEFGSTSASNDTEKAKSEATIDINIKEIGLHIKKMNFEYSRHKFPKLETAGIANVDLAGDGMSLYLSLNTRTKDDDIFQVKAVNCDIDKLRIRVHNTKNDGLYNAMLAMFPGRIKVELQNRIQSSLEAMLIDLNNAIRDNLPLVSHGLTSTINSTLGPLVGKAAEKTPTTASSQAPPPPTTTSSQAAPPPQQQQPQPPTTTTTNPQPTMPNEQQQGGGGATKKRQHKSEALPPPPTKVVEPALER